VPDDEVDDGVAEKLEPLVVVRAVAAVRQRLLEQGPAFGDVLAGVAMSSPANTRSR